MAITLTSRKVARQRLQSLLQTIATFVAVYDHQAVDNLRQSPVGMVYSDGTGLRVGGLGQERHAFWVALYWKRDNADLTEDYLDDLAVAVRTLLLAHTHEPGYWRQLDIDDRAGPSSGLTSEMGYATIDGVDWRTEYIHVTATLWQAAN